MVAYIYRRHRVCLGFFKEIISLIHNAIILSNKYVDIKVFCCQYVRAAASTRPSSLTLIVGPQKTSTTILFRS